ncbi:SapC family protein [Brevundimonas olei]|uniref:SapC family protein n=1 Tax=Brevundimonas olei TaxID=657642 RepID=UPI0031E47476
MSEASALPLFYRDPQPLAAAEHGAWRLKDGDVAFAAETAFVPVVVSEIAAAARSYPIVFSSGDGAQPIAVLGLEQRNLFVRDGRWAADAYTPAYVRRYPFGFIATVNPSGFALAIDAASERVAVSGEEGAALFENGRPTPLTQDAMAFCNAFQGEAAVTQAFGEALRVQNLLIDRRADATLPDGRKLGLDGFQVVDTERFANLDEAVVLDWHRKGWLALVHFHLASLERFGALLNLQGQAATIAEHAAKTPKTKKA